MALNTITPDGLPVFSGFVDYELRNIPTRVAKVRPDLTIVFSGTDAVAPVLSNSGDPVLESTSQAKKISLPWQDLRPGGTIYAPSTATAKVYNIPLNPSACNPEGFGFGVSTERHEDTDNRPKEESYYVYFDPTCTYSTAEKFAAIVNDINNRPQSDVVATTNGTTTLTLTAKVPGEDIIVTAGGGLGEPVVATNPGYDFGAGRTLKYYGFSDAGVNQTANYRVVAVRYFKYIHAAGHGFAFGNKEANNALIPVRKTLWAAFEATAQDTNLNALTAILYPADSRFKRLNSLTPVVIG